MNDRRTEGSSKAGLSYPEGCGYLPEALPEFESPVSTGLFLWSLRSFLIGKSLNMRNFTDVNFVLLVWYAPIDYVCP